MPKIKELSKFNGTQWETGVPIGADASNVDVSVSGGGTQNLQTVLGTPSASQNIQTQINNKVGTSGDGSNTTVTNLSNYDLDTSETSDVLIKDGEGGSVDTDAALVTAADGQSQVTLWSKFNRFRKRVNNKFGNYVATSSFITSSTGVTSTGNDTQAYTAKALNDYFANVVGYASESDLPSSADTIAAQLSSLNNKTDAVGRATAAAHNAQYRGQDLTTRYSNAELHSMITNSDFSDIYPGDYFTRSMAAFSASNTGPDSKSVTFSHAAQEVTYYVLHLDYFRTTGNTEIAVPHIVLGANIGSSQMNNTNVTTNSYNACALRKNLNSSSVVNAVNNSLGGYVLKDWKRLEANATANGKSSSWAWVTNTLGLLSEPAVYGSTVWGNGYDVGTLHTQMAAFRANPRIFGRVDWWLCAVFNSTYFAGVSSLGDATYHASASHAVIPLIIMY